MILSSSDGVQNYNVLGGSHLPFKAGMCRPGRMTAEKGFKAPERNLRAPEKDPRFPYIVGLCKHKKARCSLEHRALV